VFLDSLPNIHASKEEREEMDRIMKQKQERKEQMEREKSIMQSMHSSGGMKGGSMRGSMQQNQRRDKTGESFKKADRASISEAIDAELSIPPELREIIDDSDDDPPLKFKNHNELMEIFATLEENNLLEIQLMQGYDEELEDLKQQKKAKEREFADALWIL